MNSKDKEFVVAYASGLNKNIKNNIIYIDNNS